MHFIASPIGSIHSVKIESMAKKIKKPNRNDVLLGRGGKNNQWTGNEKLRDLARQRCQQYLTASKKGKSQISRSIVADVRRMKPQGRFLRKCSGESGEWEDVGDIIAREKASQVLRDAIQARKSFSTDVRIKIEEEEDTESRKDVTPPPTARKKDPPSTSTDTPRRELPPTPRENRRSFVHPRYAEGPSSHVYPPHSSQFSHPYYSYGRVPSSDPNTSRAPLHHEISSNPYQYPVTPSTSAMASHPGRKRSRYYTESPLVQGYHQYPYPTPIRSVAEPRPPTTSMMFTPPPNTGKRGLKFSPPRSTARVPPSSCQKTSRRTPPSSASISVLNSSEQEYSSIKMEHPSPDPSHSSKPVTGKSATSNQDFDFTDDFFSDAVELQNELIF